MSQNEKINKIYNIKIILLGETGVGKTSLINAYLDKQFNSSEIITSQSNLSFKIIEIHNKKLSLNIWDTMGHERYRSITKNFYRNADGILFVFDVTKEETFNHIKDWLISSDECDKDFKKIIVGNKIDLERVISKEKMEHFAKSKNMDCYETSAKTGDGVDKIFESIAELILKDKSEEQIREEFIVRPHSNSTLSKDSQPVEPTKKKKCC